MNNKIIPKKKQYMQLSDAERIKIQELYKNGNTIRFIARSISRDPSTISREIRRNGKLNQQSLTASRLGIKPYQYFAKKAQKSRNQRFTRRSIQTRFLYFFEYLVKNMKLPFTIEMVLFNFNKEHPEFDVPCLRTVYTWAYRGLFTTTNGVKPYKKQRKNNGKRKKNIDKTSINQRVIDFGFAMNDHPYPYHYEIDTIYDGDKKGGCLTLNDRHNMRLYAIQISDRKKNTINKALSSLLDQIGLDNVLSITSDNGMEFYGFQKIVENYSLKWYFCEPYSSWQRGQNERLNRDIRKFYKKGTTIKDIPKHKFDETIRIINNFPRRKFKGLCSYQIT